KWSGENIGAKEGTPTDQALETLHSRRAHCRIGADRVGVRHHQSDGRAGETEVVELLSQLFVMIVVAFEDWDFHAVEAGLLQLGDDGKVLFGDMRRPQEQVH